MADLKSKATSAFLRLLADAVALDLEQHAEAREPPLVPFLDRLDRRVDEYLGNPNEPGPPEVQELVGHMRDIAWEILENPDLRRLRGDP